MMKRAFTLIEMIVVLAITAIMLGIILLPIVQTFNFTRATQALTEGQQQGRRLIEQVTREIANSAGVRDNDGYRGTIAGVVPGNDGTPVTALFEYAKLDILKPAMGDPTRGPSGAFINPDTGTEDPTLRAPKGQVNLPVAPGFTITRFWIGLKNPLLTDGLSPNIYYNPHINLLRAGNNPWINPGGGDDNLFVLYRAEVEPMAGGAVNTQFFEDDGTGQPIMDDPYFFVMNAPGTPPLAGAAQAAKAQRILNWRRRATIVTDFSRYDMVQVKYQKNNRQVLVDGNLPRLVSLIQFRPASIAGEPAEGAVALRVGEESDQSRDFAPDVFRTTKKSWSAAMVRVYPNGYDPSNAAANEYLVARMDERAGVRKGKVYAYDPDLDTDDDDRTGEGVPADDMMVFDLTAYDDWARRGAVYPLTRGAAAADAVSSWATSSRGRNAFVPFVLDPASGKITTSFGIEHWGIDDPTATVAPRPDRNLPSKATGPELTYLTDATVGNFYDAAFQNINRLFNKVWNDNPALQTTGGVHRFIDLRVTPQADGTPSPLDPDPNVGFPRARIVPGSEIVMGPDQNAGPGYGRAIRYTQVTKNPGKNQYAINYVNIPEPDWATLGYAAPPAAYTPTNFVSAILQPRFKAGYIQLNSDPNVPLPGPSSISVYYRVQFNQPGDTVTVDYDTRDSMTILLTIRNYPGTTLPNPQSITLKGSAAIRNVIR